MSGIERGNCFRRECSESQCEACVLSSRRRKKDGRDESCGRLLFTNHLALTVLDSGLEEEMGSPLGFLGRHFRSGVDSCTSLLKHQFCPEFTTQSKHGVRRKRHQTCLPLPSPLLPSAIAGLCCYFLWLRNPHCLFLCHHQTR